jgi:hypothetical protein
MSAVTHIERVLMGHCISLPAYILSDLAQIVDAARREGAIEAQQRMFPCCGGNDESPAEHTMDCEHTASRLADESPVPAIPAGWRLVPVDPTPGMLEAGLSAQNEAWNVHYAHIYAEMIAAAPEAAR